MRAAEQFGSSLLHVGRSGGYAPPPVTEPVHSVVEVDRGMAGHGKRGKLKAGCHSLSPAQRRVRHTLPTSSLRDPLQHATPRTECFAWVLVQAYPHRTARRQQFAACEVFNDPLPGYCSGGFSQVSFLSRRGRNSNTPRSGRCPSINLEPLSQRSPNRLRRRPSA